MIVLYDNKLIEIDEQKIEDAYKKLEDIIYLESQKYDWIFPEFRPTISKIEFNGDTYLVVPIVPAYYDPELIYEDTHENITHEVLLKIVM